MYCKDIPAKIYCDEIFKYQNFLVECKCFDEVYNLCDEILWELECRLTIKPELQEELEIIHDEVDCGDYSRFTELRQ